MKLYFILSILIVTTSCVNFNPEISASDGTSVRGRLIYNHGFLNFRSNGICYGILTNIENINRLRRYAGRRVTLIGTIDPQGCDGSVAICSVHLCGPQTIIDPVFVE